MTPDPHTPAVVVPRRTGPGAIGADPGGCLEATIAGTAIATEHGADVVRVHDVAENVPAVRAAEEATRSHPSSSSR